MLLRQSCKKKFKYPQKINITGFFINFIVNLILENII